MVREPMRLLGRNRIPRRYPLKPIMVCRAATTLNDLDSLQMVRRETFADPYILIAHECVN